MSGPRTAACTLGHIFLQKLICVFLRAECNTMCSIVWAGAMVFHCRRSTCSNRVRRRRAACSEHQQVRRSVRTLEPHGDVGNGTRGSPCSAHQGVGMGRHRVRGPTATPGLLIPPHSAATPASVQGPDLPWTGLANADAGCCGVVEPGAAMPAENPLGAV